jgi:hypothetical protein
MTTCGCAYCLPSPEIRKRVAIFFSRGTGVQGWGKYVYVYNAYMYIIMMIMIIIITITHTIILHIFAHYIHN